MSNSFEKSDFENIPFTHTKICSLYLSDTKSRKKAAATDFLYYTYG